MGKRVLILSTSLRGDSNSGLLARRFAQGARQAGHEVEVVSLAGVVFGGGVTAPGEVRGSEAMQRALDAGRAL